MTTAVEEPTTGNLTPEQEAEAARVAAEAARTQEVTEGVDGATGKNANGDAFYTPEELKSLSFDKIDAARIPEEQLSLYKSMQASFTKKTTSLAEERKKLELERAEIQAKTPYFDNAERNEVFLKYMKDPITVVADINAEIAKAESAEDLYDEDGKVNRVRMVEVRKAVAYWNNLKDVFALKRTQVIDNKRSIETLSSKVRSELGEHAAEIEEHAIDMGFTREDFMTKAKVREAVKKAWELENVSTSASRKEIKPAPKKLATQAGSAGAAPVSDDMKLSAEDWARKRNEKKFTSSGF